MRQIYLGKELIFILAVIEFSFVLISIEIGKQFESFFMALLIVFILLVSFLFIQKRGFNKELLWLIFPFIIYQLINVIRIKAELHWIFFHFIYLFVFVLFSHIKWKKEDIFKLSITSIILLLFLFYLSINYENNELLISIPYMLDTPNANGVSAVSLYLSIFPILYAILYLNGLKKFVWVCSILTMVISTSINASTRSTLLCLIVCFLTYIIFDGIKKIKWGYIYYFIMVILFIFLLTSIYPRLEILFPKFYELNNKILSITGKRLLSGRDTLWIYMLNLIKSHPIVGYGFGVHLSTLGLSEMHSHNLYLEVLLQTGYIGLFSLMLFFFNFWKKIIQSNTKLSRFMGSFFIGLIIYQMFEISLLHFNFSIGIIPWMALGISNSFILNKEN